MTAKQRVTELYLKYIGVFQNMTNTLVGTNIGKYAKQATLICIEEMIEESDSGYDYDRSAELPYYEEMKIELEKI